MFLLVRKKYTSDNIEVRVGSSFAFYFSFRNKNKILGKTSFFSSLIPLSLLSLPSGLSGSIPFYFIFTYVMLVPLTHSSSPKRLIKHSAFTLSPFY